MPAATPIQIRYGGDPAALGGLAFAAGSARRQNADYQSQLANDRSFLRNELSRRTEDTRYRNNFNLSLLGMQANERAASAQATAMQEASGFTRRQTAQTGGVAAPIARAGQPISLVPEAGSVGGTQPGGGGYVDFRDGNDPDGPIRRVFSVDGKLERFGGGELGPDERGGYVGSGQQPQGIPADRRSALEYIKVLKGTIPEDQWNSMWVAVQQGALDPSDVPKLVDDIRSASGSGGRTPGENVARTGETAAATMWSIEQMQDAGYRREEMARYLGARPGSSESRRLLQTEGKLERAWSAAKAGATAKQRASQYGDLPNAASAGVMLGSARSNPVDLSDPSQAKNLPSGTYFRTPDGRILKRK